jgi:autotransporter family porin
VEWTGGTFTLNSGAQLNGPGLYRIRGGALAANATLSLANLDLTSGGLNGSGTVTINNVMNWPGGGMGGSGLTTISSGATLTMGGVSLGRVLENGGTMIWTGTGNVNFSGGIITNRAGALFDIQNAASLNVSSGSNRVDNNGTLRKSVNPGTTLFTGGVSLNNYGVEEIQSGILVCVGTAINNGVVSLAAGTTNRFSGGGSATGSFNLPATASVEWSAGVFALNPGSQLNGVGVYRINGGTLVANTDAFVENMDVTAGALDGPATVTVNTAMNWLGGSMSGSGRTIILPSAALQISSALVSLNTRFLDNAGSIFWTGTGNINLNSGAIITNRPGALFSVQNAAAFGSANLSGRFENAGILRKSLNTGTTTFGPTTVLNNYSTVEIQTGTLLCSGGFTNNGVVNLSAGTTNRLAGGGSAIGQFNAPATALVEWTAGTFALNAGSQLNGSGLYRINGGTLISALDMAVGNLDLLNGALNGAGTVTVNSAMTWAGGLMGGSGRTVIPSGATLNLAVPSAVTLSRFLENGGTAIWTGAGNIAFSGGVITNRAGGLFEAQNAARFSLSTDFNRFDNAGTFRKSVNSGTTTIDTSIPFNNYGLVDLQTGTLSCSGPFTNRGAVNLSAGTTNRLTAGGSIGPFNAVATALVEWIGGSFTLSTGSQLGGAGLYRINGGTVVANADLAVSNLDLLTGSLSGTGTVTVNTAMNWTSGSMGGTGRTVIPAGVTLNLAVPSAVTLSRFLENGGTVVWTGAGNILLSGGVITNRAGGLFDAQAAGNFTTSLSGNRFENVGTFRKSVNSGTTTIGTTIAFNNNGLVDIRTGILSANGAYTSTSTALVNCALGGTNIGIGYGRLQVLGTVALNGALSVELSNGFIPAQNDSFAVLTAGTRTGTFASFSYPSNQVTMQLSNTPNSVVVSVIGLVTPRPTLLTPQILATNVLLSWTAVANGTYRLEFAPALDPLNWTALPGDITSTGSIASKLDNLSFSNRFYRVRVIGP